MMTTHATQAIRNIYWLEAGFHSLTIQQREDGIKLDNIVITNDLNLGDQILIRDSGNIDR